jgi:hypothetical protein
MAGWKRGLPTTCGGMVVPIHRFADGILVPVARAETQSTRQIRRGCRLDLIFLPALKVAVGTSVDREFPAVAR